MNVKLAYAATAALAAGFLTNAAMAQDNLQTPPIYVLAENDDANLQSCRLTHESAAAAIIDQLASQNIVLATREQALTQEALVLYVQLDAEPLLIDDQPSEMCWGAANVDLMTVTTQTDPVSDMPRSTRLVFYSDTLSFVFDKDVIQDSVNANLQDIVIDAIPAYHATYRPE